MLRGRNLASYSLVGQLSAEAWGAESCNFHHVPISESHSLPIRNYNIELLTKVDIKPTLEYIIFKEAYGEDRGEGCFAICQI